MARAFNGSTDYATSTNPTTVITNWTLAAFCKIDSQLTTNQFIFFNGNAGSDGYGIYIPANTLTPNAFLGGVVVLTGSIAITAGNWFHCIISRDTTNTSLYIDASSSGTPVSNNPVTPTGSFYLGVNTTTTDGFLGGSLAEVAAWTALLDDAERAALMKGYSPFLIRPASLVEYIPWVRSNLSLKRAAPTLSGTTISIHPRIITSRKTKIPVTILILIYLRPDADDIDGSWTTETGGTTLFASIDEPTVDDADYIKSSVTPQNDIARVRISDPTSNVTEPFRIRYRYKKAGDGTVDLIVRLKQATTLIKAWTHSNIGTDFTTVTQTLSSGEFASITDFTDLFVEFEADTP